MSLFMSLVGMVVLLAIAFAFSSNRKAINFRTVGGGAFVLYVPWGRDLLNGFSQGVSNVINYGNAGTDFLFGGLVSGKMFIPRTSNANFLLCTDFGSLLHRRYAVGYPHSWWRTTKSAWHFSCGINVCSS